MTSARSVSTHSSHSIWSRIEPYCISSQNFEEKELTKNLFERRLIPASYEYSPLPQYSVWTALSLSPFLNCSPDLLTEMTKAHAYAQIYFQSDHLGNEPAQIETIISPILSQEKGAKFIKNCLNYGYYLNTLQIYFAHKPQALQGLSTLQLAATSRFIPMPFVNFLIELNKTHRLGLLTEKAWEEKTAYEVLVDPEGRYSLNFLNDLFCDIDRVDIRDRTKSDQLIKIFQSHMTLDEQEQARKRISHRYWYGIVRSAGEWGFGFLPVGILLGPIVIILANLWIYRNEK